MIHKKDLHFRYENIDFEATVTYSDDPFSEAHHSTEAAFFHVQLYKPIELDCGGKRAIEDLSLSSFMINDDLKNHRYVYAEENSLKEEDNTTNIYPLAIDKILYSYFNREKIAHYKEKVKCLKQAVDKKYRSALDAIKQKMKALKQRMKSGEITPKNYQTLLLPLRKEKEALESEISNRKWSYKEHYFQCCELRGRYRIRVFKKPSSCTDRYNS